MGCDIGPITDETADERFQESLKIRDSISSLPISFFTFGELQFLLEFYKPGHSHNIGKEELEELRRLLNKVKHPYY